MSFLENISQLFSGAIPQEWVPTAVELAHEMPATAVAAGLGGLSAGLTSYSKDESMHDVLKSAVTGLLVGAAVGKLAEEVLEHYG